MALELELYTASFGLKTYHICGNLDDVGVVCVFGDRLSAVSVLNKCIQGEV